jgi:hypothetical protein
MKSCQFGILWALTELLKEVPTLLQVSGVQLSWPCWLFGVRVQKQGQQTKLLGH